jgi:hypothetical protein
MKTKYGKPVIGEPIPDKYKVKVPVSTSAPPPTPVRYGDNFKPRKRQSVVDLEERRDLYGE